MIRQIDIAKKMGLSLAVVSRALSDERRKSDNLSEETRQAVRETAASMGYRRNLVATALKKGYSKRIAFIVHGFDTYTRMMRTIQRICHGSGYEVMFLDMGHGIPELRKNLAYLLSSGCDGIVTFLANWTVVSDLLNEFLGMKRPVAIIGTPDDTPAMPGLHRLYAPMDNALSEACRHLYQLGHRSIVQTASYIEEEQSQQDIDTSMKLPVVRQTLAALGMPHWDQIFKFRFSTNDDLIIQGEKSAAALLKQFPDTTAVIGYNDLFVIGLIHGLRLLGKRVPEDISVIGSDNIPFGTCITPALSTINFDHEKIAEIAITRVLDNIRSGDFETIPEDVRFECDFVIRESTFPLQN